MADANQDYPVFVILEKNQLVLDDLTEALRDFWPAAKVYGFLTPDAAAEALKGIRGLTGAILSVAAEELSASRLAPVLRQSGGQVLMIEGPGVRAAASTEGWPVLPRPFSLDMLRNAISGFCGGEPLQRC